MGKVICVCNQKGGVGKTITAWNLAAGLALAGKKVLCIDGDMQGSMTACFGYWDSDEIDVSVYTMMEKMINDETIMPGEGIIHLAEGMDLLPASIDMASLENMMLDIKGRENILKKYVDQVKGDYDFVIIDTNPSLGINTTNELVCADSVIIPVNASDLSFKGLTQLFHTIGLIKRKMNPGLKIEGILITKVDMRTRHAKEACEKLITSYGENVRIFKEFIPCSVRVEESISEGISILAYDKNGKVARAYMSLTEEVIADA